MSGGLLQLIAKGAYDEYYTTEKPDIVFFKSVYRKFSHFAKQLIELDNDEVDNTLRSPNQTITLKYKVPRNGSLIDKIYLEFELPSIYSDDSLQFQWIRRIGEYIIKEARVMSSNNYVYQRITGEYIHIYHETHLNEGAKFTYYNSIGHIPEMYDPAAANNYDNYLYPSTTKPTNGDNIRPSIPKKRIIVPIPFWFCTFNGTALPLCASQLNEFRIEIDIRPLNELYTIIDTDDTSDTYNTRIRPNIFDDNHKLSNFTNLAVGNTLSNNTVQLYANYIFLDNSLLNLFSKSSHDYLIRQLQVFNDETGIKQGGSLTIDLKNIYFPVTQFYFMFRRKDNSLTNQWSNYTLWEYNGEHLEDVSKPNFSSDYNNEFISGFSNDILTPDIITHSELRFNGNPYYTLQPIEFLTLNKVIYNYNDGSKNEMSGIYNYSFSLDNDKYQPSGICNFSILDKVEMYVLFKNISSMIRNKGLNFTSEYEVIFLFENLNILTIQGGLANLKFIN